MSEQGTSANGRFTRSGRDGRGRPSSRTRTAVSLALSVLFHVGVILVYSVATPEWDFDLIIPVGETPGTPIEGTRVVRIVELPPDDAVVDAVLCKTIDTHSLGIPHPNGVAVHRLANPD